MRRIPVGVQVLAGMALGIAVGLANKSVGIDMKLLGDAFIRLIEMVIVPLVFPLIVLGVAQMESVRQMGRVAGKTILYFEIVTTVILLLSVALADATNVGSGTHLAGGGKPSGVANGIDFKTFLLDIIPNNIFDALVNGKLLSVIFFALFFGLGIATVGERARPVVTFLESVAAVMFKVVDYAVRFAPIGVFGFSAYDVANYGWSGLVAVGQLIGVVYIGLLIVVFVLFPTVARLFGIRYLAVIREIWDLLLIAFTTRSSEVVLAPLMQRLERYGVHNSIVSFVLPLGYSFNLDGATLYEASAVLFLAHAYGLHLTFGQQLSILGILMVLTKGLAGVPSAAIVVLISTLQSVGLPTEGVALLMAADFVIDMARTATNVLGNSVATLVISKWENAFIARRPEAIGNVL